MVRDQIQGVKVVREHKGLKQLGIKHKGLVKVVRDQTLGVKVAIGIKHKGLKWLGNTRG